VVFKHSFWFSKKTGKHWILTKGDNNAVHDRGLYHETNRSQNWLHEDDIVGRVTGFLPYVGYVTILMNDYPQVKMATLAILALYGIVNRENS
jgi:signal peptidase